MKNENTGLLISGIAWAVVTVANIVAMNLIIKKVGRIFDKAIESATDPNSYTQE